uniref:RNA methyltransferase n=1 Tax=Synechococcus sp. UW106 TaxID=368495 RepID=UPI000E0F4B96|nr:RNA methyltransferase [Synechococcus sp. UW106]
MSLPDQLLLSDLLSHTVRCDLGLDHGPGVMAWMHPPVHRLLGWVSRPSALRMSRDVWRLNQCCGFTDQQVFVRGEPAVTDQVMLERLPTLMEATLLDRDGERIGSVVDLDFRPADGAILHYLIARSDPRLPGSSRWRLAPDRILDQQPGQIQTALMGLDDLPMARASVRQDLLQRTQRWRDQLRVMGDRAGDRLEGWLEDSPMDDLRPEPIRSSLGDVESEAVSEPESEVWDDDSWEETPSPRRRQDEDPWV